MPPSLASTVTLFTLFGFVLAAQIEEQDVHRRHHLLSDRMARRGLSKRQDITQYQLVGCVSEGSPALLTHQASWDQSSLASCVQACATESSVPYIFAGIIRGSECWCDGVDSASFDAISNQLVQLDQSSCQDTCVASGDKWCGGDAAYQLYYLPISDATTASSPTSSTASEADTSTPTSVADTPTNTPTPSDPSIVYNVWTSEGVGYNFLGCYGDSVDSRVLRGPYTESPTNTPASCATYCFEQGYPLAAIEFGTECFCGATAFTDLTLPTTGCTQACAGDASQACGAASQLAIYAITDSSLIDVPVPNPTSSAGWISQGCFIDDTTNRVLPSFQPIDITTFSVDTCVAACSTSGFKYAGVEVGGECYCGPDAPFNYLLADAHDCDYPCPAGGGSCGGLLRLNVYASP